MINGILGTIFFFLVAGGVVWLARKIADLIISIGILGSIVFIFMTGSDDSLLATLSVALILGIAVTLVTIPIWPLSSTFGKDVAGFADKESLDKHNERLENHDFILQRVSNVIQILAKNDERYDLDLLRIKKELNLPELTVAEEVFERTGVRELLDQLNKHALRNQGKIVVESDKISLIWNDSSNPDKEHTIRVQYGDSNTLIIAGEHWPANNRDLKTALRSEFHKELTKKD